MYIYIYIYIYLYIYICTYTYIHIYIHLYSCVYIYVYLYIHVHVSMMMTMVGNQPSISLPSSKFVGDIIYQIICTCIYIYLHMYVSRYWRCNISPRLAFHKSVRVCISRCARWSPRRPCRPPQAHSPLSSCTGAFVRCCPKICASPSTS